MRQPPNQARAVAFLRAHGTASEQSRWRALLAGAPATAEEETVILAGQRQDGGWAPFWAADYSAVDTICFRLAQAEQGGIAPQHAVIQRACGFLLNRQRPDGAWEEDTSVAAGAWYHLGERTLAERVLATLPHRLDETTPASSLSWLITCLRAVDMPVDHPAITRPLLLLQESQRADGGWTSEDESAADAHTTLEALRALRLCGQW